MPAQPAWAAQGARAASADELTAEALRYRPQLYGTALRLTGHAADAEDLVQETYVKAYTGFGGFTPGTNMRAWLYQIEANAFYTAYRASRRRPREVSADMVEAAVPERIATAHSAEDTALARMPDSRVWNALRALPDHLKRTVYLADAEGYKYAEIAQLTGVPLGTVMSRLHRGRKRLRACLEAAQHVPDSHLRRASGHTARNLAGYK